VGRSGSYNSGSIISAQAWQSRLRNNSTRPRPLAVLVWRPDILTTKYIRLTPLPGSLAISISMSCRVGAKLQIQYSYASLPMAELTDCNNQLAFILLGRSEDFLDMLRGYDLTLPMTETTCAAKLQIRQWSASLTEVVDNVLQLRSSIKTLCFG